LLRGGIRKASGRSKKEEDTKSPLGRKTATEKVGRRNPLSSNYPQHCPLVCGGKKFKKTTAKAL